MIAICAVLGDGRIVLTVDGHEQRAADGRVCAAVSAITHTALLGLLAVAERHPDLVLVDVTEE